MITELSLSESKNYEFYKYDNEFYEKGIKVDSCIKIDNIEAFYSHENEVIYLDDLSNMKLKDGYLDDHLILTKSMFKELIDYLGWNDWNIGITYYAYDEGLMRIEKISDEQ